MDYDKLIHCLKCCARVDAQNEGCDDCDLEYCGEECQQLCGTAATALSTLRAENSQLRESRDHWKRLAHELSEGVNGKDAEHERLQAENEKLRAEVESLKKGHCAGCSIPAVKAEQIRDLTDAPKLRAELEQVKRERDAAVEDVAAIIGDVEEIRRGYGVDNADADGAFARLCETYCANNGCLCYAECEKYHCKNFKWRGQKEG